jgi:hypothetical protein
VVSAFFFNRTNSNEVLALLGIEIERVSEKPSAKKATEKELTFALRAFNDLKNNREFKDWAKEAIKTKSWIIQDALKKQMR